MNFGDVIVAGVPLIAVVIGLVEWAKRFGLKGYWLNGMSMAIGSILGVAYQFSVQVPTTFADWFSAGIYGLALGLIASGIYDAAHDIVVK